MDLGPLWNRIHRFDMFAIAWEVILLAALLVSLGSAADEIVRGGYAPLFWIGLVVAGLVVPFVLQLRAAETRHGPATFGMALPAILVLIGGFVLRYVVVMAGPV
jgi:formate-dependent nitrite reductase membrane component NrfD